jgi:hypothetical protein
LVETTLDYGNLDDVRKLIRIMGLNYLSEIFFNLEGRKKKYYPESSISSNYYQRSFRLQMYWK